MTIYDLKPQFQKLLRPIANILAAGGATANQVTLFASLVSVMLGCWLCFASPVFFLLLPLWLFARMALNAIDGMMAREFDQQTRLGGYLNELCDVVSDAALMTPFAWIAPLTPVWVSLVIFFAVLSEYAGVMGPLVGASRRYDGPFGKSDRAAVLGLLGLWVGLAASLPDWMRWIMPLFMALSILTTINRVKHGLRECAQKENGEKKIVC